VEKMPKQNPKNQKSKRKISKSPETVQALKTTKSAAPKKKSKPRAETPSQPPKTARLTVKSTSKSIGKTSSKTKHSKVRKPAKSSPVKMLKTAPKTDPYNQFFALIKWIEFQICQFLRSFSKDPAILSTKTPIHISKEKLARLLTPARKKELLRYLSKKAMTMPPDDRILLWDFSKNGELPDEIRLDYSNPPEEFFKVPVTAKVRESIRALLAMGYRPADIVMVISQAFPGLSFSIDAIQKFKYFYWNIGDLMDTAEGQASFLNRLMKIKSDILSGQNYLHHIENLTALGKTTEIEILKTLMQNRKIEQDEV